MATERDTKPTTINPAATRYATARQAYMEALETERDLVAAGYASMSPQALHALWEEYRAARAALAPSRVKVAS